MTRCKLLNLTKEELAILAVSSPQPLHHITCELDEDQVANTLPLLIWCLLLRIALCRLDTIFLPLGATQMFMGPRRCSQCTGSRLSQVMCRFRKHVHVFNNVFDTHSVMLLLLNRRPGKLSVQGRSRGSHGNGAIPDLVKSQPVLEARRQSATVQSSYRIPSLPRLNRTNTTT